ncbi:uncharacterized protein LOC126974040 [Leptidea sinapis]|uniref:uncharacterized protein LOC126974040 n=1 Tax=Leptidea sinapis TaxID=189913 RepID=UPI0021C4A42F|nr:uncharacterized protein LOC126974040 [Leptidea sinapis]
MPRRCAFGCALRGQLQSQVILGQASSTQHLLPTIIQQDCSEPYVSNFILEKASTSTTFQPVAADASQQFTSARCLMLVHNYSFISKPKGTAGKDLMAQCTKIKHLQAEISRLRKKGQSFKAMLKGGADRSIEFCPEN